LAEKLGKFTGATFDYKKTPTGYSDSLEKTIKRVATLDFSSDRKTMSTVVKNYPGTSGNCVLLKGAPERVLDRCDGVSLHNGSTYKFRSDSEKKEMIAEINKVAAQGYRVLGFGISLDGGNMKHITDSNIKTELADQKNYLSLEGGCQFLGYVCIKDPVRPEVKDSILACHTAGINVIMITGDAKETAVAIAKELNILTGNEKDACFTGAEFEALSKEQKIKALQGHEGKVFSRVEPRHKRELVKILIEMVSFAVFM
jgi:magnesium-transporting ATPase (P-type)